MSHRRGPRSNTGRMVGASAAVLTVVVSATGAWFLSAGAVRAPEPAKLTASTVSSSSRTGAAVYDSGVPTTIIYWSGSWAPGSARAGQPCTSSPMVLGQKSTHVIIANGPYRKCY